MMSTIPSPGSGLAAFGPEDDLSLQRSFEMLPDSSIGPWGGAVSSVSPSPSAAGAVISVGIGQCAVSADPAIALVSYGLGSCVGIAAWDPLRRIAGLVHILLPEPVSSAPAIPPERFASTAVPSLLHAMEVAGARISRLRLVAAGGARMLGALSASNSPVGNIGERNAAMVCAQVSAHGLCLAIQDFGGTRGRTLGLRVGSGEWWIHVAGSAATTKRQASEGHVCGTPRRDGGLKL